MSAAVFENLHKRYEGVVALDDVSLTVEEGELLVLLGPSGSGKTTLLRVLAGLETPDRGTVRIGGRVVNDPRSRVPPEKRGLGMVFQDLALWPHMTVRESLEFVLEGRAAKDERRRRAKAAAETAGITERLDALPGTLSGGERQRVAVARALILEPALLLFDEPLTGLDEMLRVQLCDAIVDIQTRLGVAAVYVTHHPEEALAMAGRVAVLDGGRLLQCAPPEEVYARPGGLRVASILGGASFVPGRREGDGAPVVTAAGAVDVDGGGASGDVMLVVRPRALHVDPGSTVRARVRRSFFEGEGWRVLLDMGGCEVLMESASALAEGSEVGLGFDPRPAVVEAGS
jgi:ABC-type Fe3+/spermidine/putrescine transport system ATPase subunit